MTVKGNYLYIMSDYYMFTYDISNPAQPVKTSQLQHGSWHTGGAYGIGRFEVYKNYVISGEWNGIIAWDISTPATPKAGVLIELPLRHTVRSADLISVMTSFTPLPRTKVL